jgi:hypothetical protein
VECGTDAQRSPEPPNRLELGVSPRLIEEQERRLLEIARLAGLGGDEWPR